MMTMKMMIGEGDKDENQAEEFTEPRVDEDESKSLMLSQRSAETPPAEEEEADVPTFSLPLSSIATQINQSHTVPAGRCHGRHWRYRNTTKHQVLRAECSEDDEKNPTVKQNPPKRTDFTAARPELNQN